MKGADTPRVFVPPPLIVLAVLALGLAIDGKLSSITSGSMATLALGSVIAAVGSGIITAALLLFRRFQTRAEPWQPAASLVRGGIYEWTRNPMYLGILTVYLGIGLALQSVTSLGLMFPLALIIDRLVINREERYLRRRFGSSYDEYCRRVRRWL